MKLASVLSDLGPTVAYHPKLVKALGSVNAVLFLCQLAYWTGHGADPDKWIYKTMREWEDETGLTNEQQEVARKKLKAIGVLEEKHIRGVVNKKYYRINIEALHRVWGDFLKSGNSGNRKIRFPEGKKASLETVKHGLPSPRFTDPVNRETRTPLLLGSEITTKDNKQERNKKTRTQVPSSKKLDFDSEGESSIRFQTEHFFAICKACDIDLDLASTTTKNQAVKVAELLQSKGYTCQQIEVASNRWRLPTAPKPLQFQDRFVALLNQKRTTADEKKEALARNLALVKSIDDPDAFDAFDAFDDFEDFDE